MFYFFIVIGVIILDQVSKYYAEALLYGRPSYKLIDEVFHLTYARNNGAAFSIFSGNQIFLKIVTALAMSYLVFYLMKLIKEKGNITYKIGLAFILGGGIGNFIDRVRFDYVIDFFDFTLINFAIFNIADSFVVVGTIILAYLLLFNKVEI